MRTSVCCMPSFVYICRFTREYPHTYYLPFGSGEKLYIMCISISFTYKMAQGADGKLYYFIKGMKREWHAHQVILVLVSVAHFNPPLFSRDADLIWSARRAFRSYYIVDLTVIVKQEKKEERKKMEIVHRNWVNFGRFFSLQHVVELAHHKMKDFTQSLWRGRKC